jgi:hypothetical protein
MRDVNNKTILNFICEKLKQENPEFVNFKNDFKNAYIANQYSLKDEETKVKDIKAAYDKAKNNFDMAVKLSDGQSDPYCEKMTEFLRETAKQIEDF